MNSAVHAQERCQSAPPPPGPDNHAAKASRLNELARVKGWQAALEEAYPELLEYLGRKPVFASILPVDGSDLLEIGPGLGQFTSTLARRARTLHALEVDETQASFLAERLRQEDVTNVKVTPGGEACVLPNPDCSFDLVVLNLVFEWCANRMNGDHREGQTRMLSEIWRVLRPGGILYIATKNRFAIRYLMGKPDEHYSGLRFGSALPRWLANRLHPRRPPGKLYSWRGLKAMLEKARFDVERSYWAVPDMRFCEELIPLDEIGSLRRRVRQGGSRSEALVMSLLPARAVKHFAPGLIFVVRKPA